jgi:hypothetical protein
MNLYRISLFLKIYIVAVIFLVTYLFIYSIHDGQYFPIQEDEATYYNSARLFYETNSVKAVLCISENRSPVCECNWYGPFYHIIYGSIAKIIGFNKTYFIFFHYLLFMISLILFWFLPLNKIKRLIFISIYISTYIAFAFIFSYFPENLCLVLSVILLLIFVRIQIKFNNLIYLFILLILLFSLIRITNVFWIFSIVVFAKTFKEKIILSLVSILVFILVFVFMIFFTAPSHVLGLSVIHNGEFTSPNILNAVIILLNNFIHNSMILFFKANSSVFLILILLIISFESIIYNLYKPIWILKKKIILGLLIVIFSTMFAEILLYTCEPFYLEKQIAFFVPLLIYIIILLKRNYKLVLLLSIFIYFPVSILKSKSLITEHKDFNYIIKDKKDYIKNLSEFSNYIHNNKNEINILWSYADFEIPNHMTCAVLPVSINNKPILYTTNLCSSSSNDTIKFKRYYKFNIDYILSKDSISLENVDLVKYKSGIYYLYKFH